MPPVPELSKECEIQTDLDIINARYLVRLITQRLGFSAIDQARIATAVSELTRNMYLYAGGGLMRVHSLENEARQWGIEVVCADHGPGIADVDKALQDGYTTSGGMGLGLSGTKRLMDDFDLQTQVGAGTTVTIRKWRR